MGNVGALGKFVVEDQRKGSVEYGHLEKKATLLTEGWLTRDPAHVISWVSRRKQNGGEHGATTCCSKMLW